MLVFTFLLNYWVTLFVTVHRSFTVGAYLVNLTPSMIYTITPLSVLIAVLVVLAY